MMRAVLLAALLLSGAKTNAEPARPSGAKVTTATYSVRVLWRDLETRVGTIARVGDFEYEVMEYGETGFPTEQAANDRADAILEHGFRFEHDPGSGRVQLVPARFVERVEVYGIPE
jgi:hypothetical protein